MVPSGAPGDPAEGWLRNLMVAPTDQLPIRPSSADSPLVTEVATFTLDGELYRPSAHESKGRFCSRINGPLGGVESNCGWTLDGDPMTDAFLAAPGFSVEPTNPTNRFDGLRFWVVGADLELEGPYAGQDIEPFRARRADGAEDRLLETR